MNTGKCIL